MNPSVKKWILLGATLFFSAGLLASASQAPDNSKVNKGDASKGAVTAGSQKTNSSDQSITKQIRASIMKDKALSTYAHNVKIVTQDGKVTLKGPVRSEEEKSSIAEKATAIAGGSNVTNEITVAPPKQ